MGSYSARGSLRNGWLLCAVSHGAPAALVAFGPRKKVAALAGHRGCTLPAVSSISHWVFTPCRTNWDEAPSAMSGGLHPFAKYEQVAGDACWPMKLALAAGVPALTCVSDAEPLLVTPPLTVRLVRLRFPFGEKLIDLSSEDDDADAAGAAPRSPGGTTKRVTTLATP